MLRAKWRLPGFPGKACGWDGARDVSEKLEQASVFHGRVDLAFCCVAERQER